MVEWNSGMGEWPFSPLMNNLRGGGGGRGQMLVSQATPSSTERGSGTLPLSVLFC